MTRTTVVVGPRTRAGRALVALATGRGDEVFVVARHAADAAELDAADATVLRIDQDVDLLAHGTGPVRIVVCALGPVHPDEARADEAQAIADSAAFLRELAFLERLLAAVAERPSHVVLVSTVIALAPAQDRRYYGGWKGLVEQQLAESAARHAPRSGFGVVHPGRLVEGPARRVVPGLHTTYARLAVVVDAVADGRSRSGVVGLDARLWLAARGLGLLIGSFLPPRADRPGHRLEQSVSLHERSSRP